MYEGRKERRKERRKREREKERKKEGEARLELVTKKTCRTEQEQQHRTENRQKAARALEVTCPHNNHNEP